MPCVAEQRASGGLQAARLVMALVLLAFALLCVLAGQWIGTLLMLAGVVGALVAYQRGTWWDRGVAMEYVKPRLIGGAIGICVVVVAALLGSLD
jgi:hypothetical protein